MTIEGGGGRGGEEGVSAEEKRKRGEEVRIEW